MPQQRRDGKPHVADGPIATKRHRLPGERRAQLRDARLQEPGLGRADDHRRELRVIAHDGVHASTGGLLRIGGSHEQHNGTDDPAHVVERIQTTGKLRHGSVQRRCMVIDTRTLWVGRPVRRYDD